MLVVELVPFPSSAQFLNGIGAYTNVKGLGAGRAKTALFWSFFLLTFV